MSGPRDRGAKHKKVQGSETPRPPHRKRYVSPTLEVLGDIRSHTFGGSPGVGDSGPTFETTQFPI